MDRWIGARERSGKVISRNQPTKPHSLNWLVDTAVLGNALQTEYALKMFYTIFSSLLDSGVTELYSSDSFFQYTFL